MTQLEIEAFHLDGYVTGGYFGRSEYPGGGAMLLVKNHLQYSFKNVSVYLTVEKCVESCCVYFNLYVVVLYRPPSGAFDTFLGALDGMLASLTLVFIVVRRGASPSLRPPALRQGENFVPFHNRSLASEAHRRFDRVHFNAPRINIQRRGHIWREF